MKTYQNIDRSFVNLLFPFNVIYYVLYWVFISFVLKIPFDVNN